MGINKPNNINYADFIAVEKRLVCQLMLYARKSVIKPFCGVDCLICGNTMFGEFAPEGQLNFFMAIDFSLDGPLVGLEGVQCRWRLTGQKFRQAKTKG